MPSLQEPAMPISVEELAAQANSLSPDDRSRLADLLVASMPGDVSAEVEVAWEREIERRVAEVHAGTARLVPSADVHAQARRIYQR
jgi:putative addiction module component (TIGR02574 family)